MNTIRINPDRPLEELTGSNRGILRIRIGNIHVMTPFTEVVRRCRPKNIRKASPALRRGLILMVHQTLMEYRQEFLDVVNGNVGR